MGIFSCAFAYANIGCLKVNHHVPQYTFQTFQHAKPKVGSYQGTLEDHMLIKQN